MGEGKENKEKKTKFPFLLQPFILNRISTGKESIRTSWAPQLFSDRSDHQDKSKEKQDQTEKETEKEVNLKVGTEIGENLQRAAEITKGKEKEKAVQFLQVEPEAETETEKDKDKEKENPHFKTTTVIEPQTGNKRRIGTISSPRLNRRLGQFQNNFLTKFVSHL